MVKRSDENDSLNTDINFPLYLIKYKKKKKKKKKLAKINQSWHVKHPSKFASMGDGNCANSGRITDVDNFATERRKFVRSDRSVGDLLHQGSRSWSNQIKCSILAWKINENFILSFKSKFSIHFNFFLCLFVIWFFLFFLIFLIFIYFTCHIHYDNFFIFR